MEKMDVKLGDYCYPFFLGNRCEDEIVDRLLEMQADRYFIIADATVSSIYAEPILHRLNMRVPASLEVHETGEKSKTLHNVEQLAESLVRRGASRNSCIVAVGGGVTCNIAGVVAGLMFRGIRLVHVPTTLVAILDSVISLKQAVNSSHGKNTFGMYYCPEMILGDVSTLQSLSACHVRSGLCEVIKNAVAVCPDQIPFLEANLVPECRYSDGFYLELIHRNVIAKCEVIHDDAYERKHGLVFEYGHTVGHAIEFCEHGDLSHGEAVGLGMLVAAEIGRRFNNGLTEAEAEIHRQLLMRIGAPVSWKVDSEEIFLRLAKDNKTGHLPRRPDEFPMIILESLGRARHTANKPLIYVSKAAIERALDAIH
jgi:3-dehydroquinate synthetase